MHRYRRLLVHARPHARTFGLIGGLTLFGSVLVALQPWPIKIIVDSALQGQPLPPSLNRLFEWLAIVPSPSALVVIFALASLIVAALHLTNESLLAWNWTRAGRRMVFDLAAEMFARL